MSSLRIARKVIKTVDIPLDLAKSLQGTYFIGTSELLNFGNDTQAWAGLINPCTSDVYLHLDRFTVTNLSDTPFDAEVWFNAQPPGMEDTSYLVSPTNTTLFPLPDPSVKLQFASRVCQSPSGTKVYVPRVPPQDNFIIEEDGKFIFPPGGSFIIFLTNPQDPQAPIRARVAFEWWEERIKRNCK